MLDTVEVRSMHDQPGIWGYLSKLGNYPGVTVEDKVTRVDLSTGRVAETLIGKVGPWWWRSTDKWLIMGGSLAKWVRDDGFPNLAISELDSAWDKATRLFHGDLELRRTDYCVDLAIGRRASIALWRSINAGGRKLSSFRRQGKECGVFIQGRRHAWRSYDKGLESSIDLARGVCRCECQERAGTRLFSEAVSLGSYGRLDVNVDLAVKAAMGPLGGSTVEWREDCLETKDQLRAELLRRCPDSRELVLDGLSRSGVKRVLALASVPAGSYSVNLTPDFFRASVRE